MADPLGPVRDAERRRDLLRPEPDNRRIGPIREFRVSGMMIAVPMRMGDQKPDRAPLMAFAPLRDQPVDRGANPEPPAPVSNSTARSRPNSR
jgi:hypothetical protein